MADAFLDKAYSTRTAAETRDLYDAWACSYDSEIGANGYATPARCAAALAEFLHDPEAPILDFGCGTGISGKALAKVGFRTIDGMDLSADMLVHARERAIYRDLKDIAPDTDPGIAPGAYKAIAAIGVIGAGAAPLATFDTLMHALAPRGLFVFSFNDHALEDPASEGRVAAWTETGAAVLLFREYGPHLPGRELNSNVYVIEKT